MTMIVSAGWDPQLKRQKDQVVRRTYASLSQMNLVLVSAIFVVIVQYLSNCYWLSMMHYRYASVINIPRNIGIFVDIPKQLLSCDQIGHNLMVGIS